MKAEPIKLKNPALNGAGLRTQANVINIFYKILKGEEKMEKRVSLILMFLSSILFMAAAGSGAILNVPADYPTIQAAVDAAGAGDAVIIAVGTYTGDGNRDIDPNGKAVTIRSTEPNDPEIVAATVIDCNGSSAEPHRGFYFHHGEDGDSVVNGLTITNGYAEEGGGISCGLSNPAITNCIFSGNSARTGGSMANYRSSPAITNCSFTGNSAKSGGAMWNKRGNPAITNCIFSSNSVEGDGGVMYNDYLSKPAVSNCTFNNNSADRGGAMYNYVNNSAITNCTFTGNSARREGGAICDWGIRGFGRGRRCDSQLREQSHCNKLYIQRQFGRMWRRRCDVEPRRQYRYNKLHIQR
jgi:predicted outer membrane repeat protein